MATDATESEGSLKHTGTTNTVINKSSGESDTPRISATLENKPRRVTEQGSDENAVTADCTPTEAMISANNAEQAVLSSPSKTEGAQEESSRKGQSEESTRTHSSSPVTLPHAHSPLEHNGR